MDEGGWRRGYQGGSAVRCPVEKSGSGAVRRPVEIPGIKVSGNSMLDAG